MFVRGPVAVRVPATSANLGPGFDSLGIALGLYDVVTAEVLDAGADDGADDGGIEVTVEGEGAGDVPLDESHLVCRSMLRAFAEMGVTPGVPLPRVRVHCRNVVPHGRGLGSSSAAIVAGLSVARALVVDGTSRCDDDALFALAARIEGHPDNVAPAVYGGFTIAYTDDGAFRAVRLEVSSEVAFVVFVPPAPLSTHVARALLPASVSHDDATRNTGRAALLVAALTGRPDVLLAATEDRLHQAYRATAMPESAALLSALRADGVPAMVSGAGPAVLAVVPPSAVPEVTARVPEGWRVLHLHADLDGARRLP
ncbi:MAG: homoserine kinase [Nocardioidaceae bacterium]|nr:homoserine kinase [Nocardioidaceae bacterium]